MKRRIKKQLKQQGYSEKAIREIEKWYECSDSKSGNLVIYRLNQQSLEFLELD